jgi:hypothetical protein
MAQHRIGGEEHPEQKGNYLMMLIKEFKELARDAAKKMKGAAKRAFMAQITREYLGGSPRKGEGERELGGYRKNVEKGLKEQETGIYCVDNYAARGCKKTDETLANLERDIYDLVKPNSQVDPILLNSLSAG